MSQSDFGDLSKIAGEGKFAGKVFFGRACAGSLKSGICSYLGVAPGKVNIEPQNDGEIYVKYLENVRDYDVYIVQPTNMPYENFFELLIMVDAASRSSAGRITAVVPYLLHARQDRKDQPRVSLTAKLVAKQISGSGINRIILLDLHAGQIQGFFDENVVKVDELYATSEFAKIIGSFSFNNIFFCAVDAGGIKRARWLANKFNAGLAFTDKQRPTQGKSETISLTIEIGESLQDSTLILVDDLVDTAGSLVGSAEVGKKLGSKEIYAFITHPVFSKDALAKIQASSIKKVFVTDSITRDVSGHDKVEVISLGELFGKAIFLSNQKHQSLSSLFR